MKNIRTSVSEYMNYCRHNKFSANTSVNLGENDKVNKEGLKLQQEFTSEKFIENVLSHLK